MNTDVKRKYTESRRKDPLFSARYALANAKMVSDSGKWEAEGGHDAEWTMEQDGLTIKLRVEDESIFPIPDRHGVTDFGTYVDELRSDYYEGDWGGNWPPPAEKAPLGLPYTAIRYSGPGWVQGDMSGGYFILDGIEEHFEWKRRQGQSKSVAWDLTRKFVEDQLTMLFCSPLTNCVVIVSAWSEDIELASTAIGTDVSGDDEGRDYIFQMVEENGMIDEVVEDAKAEIKRMAALEA
jgi:hypothetical protein